MTAVWLDRRIALPGPHLALCLSEEELKEACADLKCSAPAFVVNAQSDATSHYFELEGRALTVIVCLKGWEARDPIEVAGLLIHEAVHIWQQHAEHMGETEPGDEQEAYAVQCIAQELLAEFARRMGAR